MSNGPPKLIAIDHDDYHAKHVGKTADGRQFFLTSPFEPAMGANPGREFIALYLFDKAGQLIEAKIEDLGLRATVSAENEKSLAEQWLQELGKVKAGRIKIAPFAVERFGLTFGLIPRAPEGPDGEWYVILLPGDYVAFSEPWDSGEYDT